MDFKLKLEDQFGLCRLSKFHAQVAIPCVDKPPTKSDKQRKSLIGVIQVQSYTLRYILTEMNLGLERGIEKVLMDSGGVEVTICHLCKGTCLLGAHCRRGNRRLNLGHDYCGAFWVIKDKLVSLCSCTDGVEDKCLAPGPHYCCSNVSEALAAIANPASSSSVSSDSSGPEMKL
jgi:hypothetical protein